MLKLQENKACNLMPHFIKWVIKFCLLYIHYIVYVYLLDSVFTVYCQFRKAPEGSLRKNTAQKQVLEAMSHRMHVDNSVKLIGKLLFGIEKGPEVLNAVRPAGSALVDDWHCLKTMVSFLF